MENRRDHPVGIPIGRRGNVLRLTLIIFAAEMVETAKPGGGQAAGNFVHDNGILSLLPYVPAFIGVFILGRVIKEDDQTDPEPITEESDE